MPSIIAEALFSEMNKTGPLKIIALYSQISVSTKMKTDESLPM